LNNFLPSERSTIDRQYQTQSQLEMGLVENIAKAAKKLPIIEIYDGKILTSKASKERGSLYSRLDSGDDTEQGDPRRIIDMKSKLNYNDLSR
jgi:hypothetical protein